MKDPLLRMKSEKPDNYSTIEIDKSTTINKECRNCKFKSWRYVIMKAFWHRTKTKLQCLVSKCFGWTKFWRTKKMNWATCVKGSKDSINNLRNNKNGKIKIKDWSNSYKQELRKSKIGKFDHHDWRIKLLEQRSWIIMLKSCRIRSIWHQRKLKDSMEF